MINKNNGYVIYIEFVFDEDYKKILIFIWIKKHILFNLKHDNNICKII